MCSLLRRSLSSRQLLWALLLSLAGVGACSKFGSEDRRPAVIIDVVDQASNSAKSIRFDTGRARRYLEKALEKSKAFRLGTEQEEGVYRIKLYIVLASERQAGGAKAVGVYRAVQVEVKLTQARSQGGDSLLATGKQFLVQDPDREDKNDGFDSVLEMAVQRAVDVADLQVDMRSMELGDLRRALTEEMVERRLYALKVLRQRKAPDLVPDIIVRLNDVDADVVLEAVGALVAQRDRRAVIPLIRSTNGRDSVFLLQIITALGELGGVQAKGYLYALSVGHDSESVRRRAHEVFIELEATDPRKRKSGRVVALPKTVHGDGRVK